MAAAGARGAVDQSRVRRALRVPRRPASLRAPPRLMDIPSFLIQLLNSVQYGLLLFMLAAGLTLIFGIMGVVNLAHGSFYMLGAYIAWWLASLSGSFTVAVIGGAILSVIFGLLLERLLFRH